MVMGELGMDGIEELVRGLIVESDVKIDNGWIEYKKKVKNERLMRKYGVVIKDIVKKMEIIDVLGVRKGFGWDYWKMEISGVKEEMYVVEDKRLRKNLMERKEDRIERRMNVNREKDVCFGCLEEKCLRDKIDKNGWMRVGYCEKLFNIDMNVDDGEWLINVNRNVMYKEDLVKRIEEGREEFERKWENGEYLKEWRIRRDKRLEVIMDFKRVKKEMMRREVKDLSYDGVLRYRRIELEKIGILME